MLTTWSQIFYRVDEFWFFVICFSFILRKNFFYQFIIRDLYLMFRLYALY